MDFETIVAIPVRNEEFHLGAFLASLSAQTHPADTILLLLNNCTDASLDICQHASRQFDNLRIIECHLRGADASAGEARRLAIEHALNITGDGVILTTDADTTVPATWIADNLAEIENDADCVCGMAIIAPACDGPNRPRLEFDDMREQLLLTIQDEIAAIVDPDPFDPWPRHQQHSGASIAVRANILRQAGGAPRVPAGEDRALVAQLNRFDARIRHAPQIQVTVSGRAAGRAVGGMADTIRRRLKQRDWLTDDTLEPTIDAYRRVLTRVRLRAARQGEASAHDLATDLGINQHALRLALQSSYFGIAWEQIQSLSPVLHRRRVAFADLARETRQALALRDELRASVTQSRFSLVAE